LPTPSCRPLRRGAFRPAPLGRRFVRLPSCHCRSVRSRARPGALRELFGVRTLRAVPAHVKW
jgi:hypothetical protein